MERGDPISYEVLEAGTPVYTDDGATLGTVKRVLADSGADIFDGIIVDTDDGERFVHGEGVGALYERAVELKFDAREAARLPQPSGAPAAMSLDATDVTESSPAERARRVWDLISGKW